MIDNLALARALAGRYGRGDPDLLEELEQVAAVGLVQAAQRFDPGRGIAFSTFAVPTVLGELRRYFRATGWVVHVPRGLQEKLLRLRRVEHDLSTKGGGPPGTAELARALGWEAEDLLEVLVAAHALSPASLDAPTRSDEDTVSLGARLGGNDPGYREWELRHELDQAMAMLDASVAEAVRLRFGEELSFSELARRIGVSRAHASRLVDRALHQLGAVMQPGAT